MAEIVTRRDDDEYPYGFRRTGIRIFSNMKFLNIDFAPVFPSLPSLRSLFVGSRTSVSNAIVFHMTPSMSFLFALLAPSLRGNSSHRARVVARRFSAEMLEQHTYVQHRFGATSTPLSLKPLYTA